MIHLVLFIVNAVLSAVNIALWYSLGSSLNAFTGGMCLVAALWALGAAAQAKEF